MTDAFFRDCLRHFDAFGDAEFVLIENALYFLSLVEDGELVSTDIGWIVRRRVGDRG